MFPRALVLGYKKNQKHVMASCFSNSLIIHEEKTKKVVAINYRRFATAFSTRISHLQVEVMLTSLMQNYVMFNKLNDARDENEKIS